jgi:ribosomal protein S18 acetylase RimI-like enzyme
MRLDQAAPAAPLPAGLGLRPAAAEDLTELARMDGLCFEVPAAEAERHLQRDLTDSQHRLLVATLAGEKIGKIGVLLNTAETYIFGFCLRPEHRHKGYGTAILRQTVSQLLAERRPNIVLEVACQNENALRVYQRSGFQVETAYDYYRLPVG